ncbi:MAG: efflux RND transporter periplasmic adaptor subunit [Verrucomicrobiota bacterium]
MSLNQLVADRPIQSRISSDAGPRFNLPTWLIPISLLLSFFGLFLILFGQRLMPAQPVAVAPVVTLRSGGQAEAATDLQSNPTLLFQASGWVEPDPYLIEVPFLVSGIVDTVHVLEGDAVQKGDLIATLVNDEARLDLAAAVASRESHLRLIEAHCHQIPQLEAKRVAMEKSIAAAEARLEEADDRSKRFEALPEGSIAKQEVIAARLQRNAEAARVEELRASVVGIDAEIEQVDLERISMEARLRELQVEQERAQLALDRHRVIAPIDGIVYHTHVRPGGKRMLAMDDPESAIAVELFQPEKLQARIDVPLNEAAGLLIDQPVELTTDLLADSTFKGVVTRITGDADIQRNTLQAKVRIYDPDPRLRPDMLVRARFYSLADEKASSESDQAGRNRLSLFVPESAVVDGQLIWVVGEDQRAEQREIVLADERREDYRRVVEGIRSGEEVILPPHADLEEGQRIKPVTTQN